MSDSTHKISQNGTLDKMISNKESSSPKNQSSDTSGVGSRTRLADLLIKICRTKKNQLPHTCRCLHTEDNIAENGKECYNSKKQLML